MMCDNVISSLLLLLLKLANLRVYGWKCDLIIYLFINDVTSAVLFNSKEIEVIMESHRWE